jgi:Flp pilus assembly pilin Flp
MSAKSLLEFIAACRSQALRAAREEQGQDLIEYALLVGFVTISAWAIFPMTILPSASTILSRLLSRVNYLVGI